MSLPDDSNELELTYNDHHPAYEIGNGYAPITITVPDLEAFHTKHHETGYETTKLMGLPGTELDYYLVFDPDGYKIEVIRERLTD